MRARRRSKSCAVRMRTIRARWRECGRDRWQMTGAASSRSFRALSWRLLALWPWPLCPYFIYCTFVRKCTPNNHSNTSWIEQAYQRNYQRQKDIFLKFSLWMSPTRDLISKKNPSWLFIRVLCSLHNNSNVLAFDGYSSLFFSLFSLIRIFTLTFLRVRFTLTFEMWNLLSVILLSEFLMLLRVQFQLFKSLVQSSFYSLNTSDCSKLQLPRSISSVPLLGLNVSD